VNPPLLELHVGGDEPPDTQPPPAANGTLWIKVGGRWWRVRSKYGADKLIAALLKAVDAEDWGPIDRTRP
jgi:hypothetical protein